MGGTRRKIHDTDTRVVEIWDCSGDASFFPSWPALAQDAHALIYVCSPESKSDDNVDTWYHSLDLIS